MLENLRKISSVDFYNFDQIPSNRDGFLISEETIELFEKKAIKSLEGKEHPHNFVEYYWCCLKENNLKILISRSKNFLEVTVDFKNEDLISSFDLSGDITSQYYIVVSKDFLDKIKSDVIQDLFDNGWL